MFKFNEHAFKFKEHVFMFYESKLTYELNCDKYDD